MAKIGLQNFRFGELTENSDGSASYGVGHKPGKAVSCSVDITNNDGSLYADDAEAESDTSFQSGTLSMGVDDEDDITNATMLGHQIVNGEVTRNTNDVAPYLGVGRIITKMVNGVYKYKVEFLCKVKMSESSQSENTRGETIEFGTSTLSGKILRLGNGDWSKTETFDTMEEAQAYLDSFFESPTAATVSFDNNGGSGSYSSVSTYEGAIINVPDGSALTPPTGKVFAGWDTSSSATQPDIIGTYRVPGTITLYAVYVDE